jgi:WD40 repeat protein
VQSLAWHPRKQQLAVSTSRLRTRLWELDLAPPGAGTAEAEVERQAPSEVQAFQAHDLPARPPRPPGTARPPRPRLFAAVSSKAGRPAPAQVPAMAYDPSGGLLATSDTRGAVRVWDVEKGFCTHNFSHHDGPPPRPPPLRVAPSAVMIYIAVVFLSRPAPAAASLR